MGVRRRASSGSSRRKVVLKPDLVGQLLRVTHQGTLLGIIRGQDELGRDLDMGEIVLALRKVESCHITGYVEPTDAWIVLVSEGILGWLYRSEMEGV